MKFHLTLERITLEDMAPGSYVTPMATNTTMWCRALSPHPTETMQHQAESGVTLLWVVYCAMTGIWNAAPKAQVLDNTALFKGKMIEQ